MSADNREGGAATMKLTPSARLCVAIVTTCGAAMLGYAILTHTTIDPLRFASFLVVGILAAVLKVKLPRMDSSISVNLPFILLAVSQLSLLEALLVGCCSTAAQNIVGNRQRPAGIQVLFNLAAMANAVCAAFLILNKTLPLTSAAARVAGLAIAVAAFYIANTAPVAIILALLNKQNAIKLWGSILLWSFPYYLASAGIACAAVALRAQLPWHIPLWLLPLMWLVYCSYRVFVSEPERFGMKMAARAG